MIKTGSKAETDDFSVQTAKAIVSDLFIYRPALYWLDFLISLTVGYTAAFLYFTSPAFSLAHIAGFIIAGFALFRCGTFIHEIVHMPKGEMTAFKIAYNVLFAPLTLSPSFTYRNHSDHHKWNRYGTAHDGEYPQLGRGPRHLIIWYMAEVAILPALAIFRFLVLTPISYLHPRLRRFVLERASSYVSNPKYRRQLPPNEKRWTWVLSEVICFIFLSILIWAFVTEQLPWTTFLEIYVLAAFAAGLNWVRNLVAHTYTNDGQEMSYVGQLHDSINMDAHPVVTFLLFPVGLKYHALHHLFPALPYHALGTAHRRLISQLPEDSIYRKTSAPGFIAAFRRLWKNAGQARTTSQRQLESYRRRYSSQGN